MTNIKYKIQSGTCPWTPQRTTKGQQKDTNNNENNIYIYFINKYRKQNLNRLSEKMKFLRDIKNDNKYSELTEEDEYDLRDFVLKN